MYTYPTRREKHAEQIEKFLDDETRKTLELRLYPREISILPKEHPGIVVIKGAPYGKTALFTCDIVKW